MVMAPAKQRKIDADSHFFPQMDFGDLSEVLPGLSREAQEMVIRDAIMFTNPSARSGGFRASAAGQRVGATNPSGARGGGPVGHGVVADRVKLLPETGFDMQVLIPDGPFFNPFGSPVGRHGEPGMVRAMCRAFNNASGKAQSEFPDSFIATAIVPWEDVGAACDEAKYAAEQLGIKALTINGNWEGKNYDEIELYPFWKVCNDLGLAMFVHHTPFSCQVRDHVPTSYTIGWERMRRLHISNYLGFAMEGMMAMASLTLGGLLEEFPNLKFCFFESGASWLPWTMYTLDRVYGVEPQCARCSEKPSDLIRRSCFVAAEPDEGPLASAVMAIGSENIIIGSDYPHPPSTYPNTAAGIAEMDGLSDQDKRNILGGNLQRLFGLA